MKFSAIQTLARQAAETATRFPFTMLSAAVATTAAVLLVASRSSPPLSHLVMAALLGLPLLTALELVAERRTPSGAARFAIPAVGLAALASFFSLAGPGSNDLNWTRFLHWALGFHLLVAVTPVAAAAGARAFWQFNRLLFERAVLASVYALILFLGLALAMVALTRLFGVQIDNDRYPQLFAVLALLFHPWFFLSGVPRDWEALEQSTAYPVGLKILAQYILVPLVTVYLAILLAYLAKVAVSQQWPSGWIGYLVSGVSVAGTFALVLVHPIRERAEERWVNGYARWFFLGLIPPLLMALLAVGKRISQYGVTEPRYVLLVLALWLLGVALYYTGFRSRSIRPIPVSLAVVVLATTFGPWGMFATAKRSQAGRFETLAARVRTQGEPDSNDRRELVAVVDYLDRVHGRRAMAGALGLQADQITATNRDSLLAQVFATSGLPPIRPEDQGPTTLFFSVTEPRGPVEGQDVGDGIRVYGNRGALTSFQVRYGADTLTFVPHRAAGELAVTRRDSLLMVLNVHGAMAPVLRDPRRPDVRTDRPIVLEGAVPGLRIRFLIQSGHWMVSDSNSRSADGILVIGPQ